MSEEDGVSRFVQIALAIVVGGFLLYALYPVVDALNHTYALLFLFAVGVMLVSLVYGYSRRALEG